MVKNTDLSLIVDPWAGLHYLPLRLFGFKRLGAGCRAGIIKALRPLASGRPAKCLFSRRRWPGLSLIRASARRLLSLLRLILMASVRSLLNLSLPGLCGAFGVFGRLNGLLPLLSLLPLKGPGSGSGGGCL